MEVKPKAISGLDSPAMRVQQRLLQGMLALLGLAALTGLGTILFPGFEIAGRLGGTLGLTATATALAWAVSGLLEKDHTRPTGTTGLVAITVGLVLAVAAVWSDLAFGWRIQSCVTGTALAYVPAAGAFVWGYASRRGTHRFAGQTLMIAAGTAFALALVATWSDLFATAHDLPAKSGKTAGIVAVAGMTASAGLVGFPASGRWWSGLGVGAAALGLLLGLHGTWLRPGSDPTWMVQTFLIAGGVGVANVLLTMTLPSAYAWLRPATLLLLLGTTLTASFVNVASGGFTRMQHVDVAVRTLSASGIATACGVLAIVIVRGFSRRVLATHAPGIAAIRHVALTCPRCGIAQRVAIGESRCGECGLVLIVRVAEPRCPACDYPLLDLKARVCPECGTPTASSPSPASA